MPTFLIGLVKVNRKAWREAAGHGGDTLRATEVDAVLLAVFAFKTLSAKPMELGVSFKRKSEY